MSVYSIFGLWFSLFWLISSVAWGGERDCVRFYRQRRYLQAGRCFEEFAARLSGRGARVQMMRGRAMRNASSLYARYAKEVKAPELASYWRERAAGLLRRYLRLRLYETPARQRSAQQRLAQLQKQIGYARLILVIPAGGRALLAGYRYKQVVRVTSEHRLRPGRYEVRLFLRGQRPKLRSFQLAPGAFRVFVLSPPCRPKGLLKGQKLHPASWMMIGIGGGLSLLGVILMAVAEDTDHQKVALNLRLLAGNKRTSGDVERLRALHGQAQTLYLTAWLSLGLGLTTASAGVVSSWLLPPLSRSQQ